MAAALNRALLAALVLVLCAAQVPAALPSGAGVARAVAGQWADALDRFDSAPATERTRADRYFRAAAQLQLGLRRTGLAGLRELIDADGPFSGAAMELAVRVLFEEGRHAEVVAWAASGRADRFQDPDSMQYRVGQSYLLLDQPTQAAEILGLVRGGDLLPYALHSRALLEVSARRFGPAVDLLGEAITAAEVMADGESAVLADALRVDRGRVLYQLGANSSGLEEGERIGLVELAQQQFEKVSTESALYPQALQGIGWCAVETGDSSRSLASFAAAGEMDPVGRSEALWAQGRVYQRLGFYEEAAQYYRQAGEAAVETAAVLVGGEQAPAPVPVPAAARWERRGELAGTLLTRRSQLGDQLVWLSRATEARDLRLAAAARQIELRRARVAEIKEELTHLTARLQEFLDQIPAAALFPPGIRGRVRFLGALQQRLNNDVTRVENALGAIGNTVFWAQSDPAQQARGQALWERLGRTKERLGELQLGFLQALKNRVSQREIELARQIEQLQQGTIALAEPIADAGRAHQAAVARGETLRARLESLRGRLAALAEPVEGLRATALGHVDRAETLARKERAKLLRLSADAYALDEAQALHLMQERPR